MYSCLRCTKMKHHVLNVVIKRKLLDILVDSGDTTRGCYDVDLIASDTETQRLSSVAIEAPMKFLYQYDSCSGSALYVTFRESRSCQHL